MGTVRPLIYTSRTARALFAAACLVWNVPELFGMVRQMASVSRKDATTRDGGSLGVLIGCQWIGLALNFALPVLLPRATIRQRQSLPFGIGVSLMLVGTAVRWYAILTLRNYFTRDVAVSAHQPVVQAGPYRYVRHPAYSGTFLTLVGVGLATTNWASLLALLVFVAVGHLYRMRIEEAALIATIGAPYEAYMRGTRRFIPGLL
jgi:protein-S-isoprenylcysteine O-methyltransferase Ste14